MESLILIQIDIEFFNYFFSSSLIPYNLKQDHPNQIPASLKVLMDQPYSFDNFFDQETHLVMNQ